MHNIFSKDWEYIPVHQTPHPYHSFAIDDVLQEKVTKDGVPKLRAWVHHPYVILGLHDARLPYLKDGLKYLDDSGFDYIVRNSGGLGVVLDEGVLNVSLVISKEDSPMIDDGYDMMLEMVRCALPEADIEAYEIVHSYCPGSYDLSIGGQKFAGISQRRIKGGAAVQIYLCVSGSGSERARIMRDFYHYAKKDSETKFSYPDIHPSDMASLNTLLNETWTVEDVLQKMMNVIQGDITMLTDFSEDEQERYEKSLKNMKKRNASIRGDIDKDLTL